MKHHNDSEIYRLGKTIMAKYPLSVEFTETLNSKDRKLYTETMVTVLTFDIKEHAKMIGVSVYQPFWSIDNNVLRVWMTVRNAYKK